MSDSDSDSDFDFDSDFDSNYNKLRTILFHNQNIDQNLSGPQHNFYLFSDHLEFLQKHSEFNKPDIFVMVQGLNGSIWKYNELIDDYNMTLVLIIQEHFPQINLEELCQEAFKPSRVLYQYLIDPDYYD